MPRILRWIPHQQSEMKIVYILLRTNTDITYSSLPEKVKRSHVRYIINLSLKSNRYGIQALGAVLPFLLDVEAQY